MYGLMCWHIYVCKDYSLVAVSAGTVEYRDIAKLFYHTMIDLNAIILHIHRLQNPVLWQFYAMFVPFVSFVLHRMVNVLLMQILQVIEIANPFVANVSFFNYYVNCACIYP